MILEWLCHLSLVLLHREPNMLWKLRTEDIFDFSCFKRQMIKINLNFGMQYVLHILSHHTAYSGA